MTCYKIYFFFNPRLRTYVAFKEEGKERETSMQETDMTGCPGWRDQGQNLQAFGCWITHRPTGPHQPGLPNTLLLGFRIDFLINKN